MTKQSGHSGIRKALFFAGTSAGILLFLLTGIFFRAAQTEDSEKTSGPAAGKKERSAGKAANSVFNCQYDNLHLGIPGKTDCLIDRYGFALGYSEKHEQALFVVYLLTAEKLEHKIAERGNRFLSDPEIPTGSADDQDYKRSGYDRGHLAPAADMVFSQEAMKNSFYYSNISPQAPGFNRGIWKKLEEQVRFFARTEKKIYVVSGPVFDPGQSISIGNNQVTVPAACYKVIYDLTTPEKMIGFILPNRKSSKSLQHFAVPVDTVEEKTGLDFFPLLPDDQENVLESSIDLEQWQWLK